MPPGRIMIVEDNPITRKAIRTALRDAGHDVVEAADGTTALRLMAEQAPDVILQDLRLTDIDGIELCRKLRSMAGGHDVRILALTGMVERLDEAKGEVSGFDDLLVKPLKPSQIVERVRAHLPR